MACSASMADQLSCFAGDNTHLTPAVHFPDSSGRQPGLAFVSPPRRCCEKWHNHGLLLESDNRQGYGINDHAKRAKWLGRKNEVKQAVGRRRPRQPLLVDAR